MVRDMKWAMVVKGGAYRVSGSQGAGQRGPRASMGRPEGVSLSRGQGPRGGQEVGLQGPRGPWGGPTGSQGVNREV